MKKLHLHSKDTKEQGFNLIELLVVILIIGILAAIAIPAFLNQRKEAVDSSVKSDVLNAGLQVKDWDVKNKGQTKPLPTGEQIKDSSLDLIKVSSGSIVEIRGNSADYCILGKNPGGSLSSQGIAYSSSNGGIVEENFSCDNSFTPKSSPTMNSVIRIDDTGVLEENPELGEDTLPEGSNPVDVPQAVTCDDVKFTASAGTKITCAVSATNWSQDTFTINVMSDSSTPILWNVDVNASRAKGFKQMKIWASGTVIDDLTIKSPSYSVTGIDRSWNKDPNHANNYKYISSSKPMSFTVQVEWR